jgi:hypothetical protein
VLRFLRVALFREITTLLSVLNELCAILDVCVVEKLFKLYVVVRAAPAARPTNRPSERLAAALPLVCF